MILHLRIRTESDRWFSKYLWIRLDRILFHRIRTGLGLENFTVRSSLQPKQQCWKPKQRPLAQQEFPLARFIVLTAGATNTVL